MIIDKNSILYVVDATSLKRYCNTCVAHRKEKEVLNRGFAKAMCALLNASEQRLWKS